jgi:TatD DNase family protein
MVNLTDTHCHIDLYHDPKAVIVETETNRIYTIAVTNTPSVYPHTQALCNNLRYIRPAVGLHPELAAARHKELPQMWKFLSSTRYVGEVGLDYTTGDLSERDLQLRVFEEILVHCAEYGDKIITVHSRRAASDVISAIGENYPGTIILHWYSGSVRDLNRAIEYGCHFSVNFSMLKSEKGRKLVAKMPWDRVITETDGPFITISREPSRPIHISRTIKALADLWEISVDDTRVRVFENFRKLLDRASLDSI